MATISKHGSQKDWCHICGARSDNTVDVWYPQNAEHATKKQHKAQIGPDILYVRICGECAVLIAIESVKHKQHRT